METSRRAASTLTLALLTLLALFTSCSSEEQLIDCPECVIVERTDLSITGELDIQNFDQSMESDASNDLVSFTYYGTPSPDFDYRIALSNGYALIIKVHDEENLNPWRQVNTPYNIYPEASLPDKLAYTTIELRTSANEPLYSSNLNGTTSPGIYLDVFQVTEYDGTQLQARVRDMILYKYNDPEKIIRINGTFVGAVTFE